MTTPKLNLHLAPSTLKYGFTQSELSLMDECSLKWNFRYNNLLKKANTFEWHFWIGQSWHEFQDAWRKSKGNCDVTKLTIPKGVELPTDGRDSEFEATLDYWTQVLPAYQETYARLYREEATHDWALIEQVVETEFMGFKLLGKIDLVSNKPKFIRDFKSTVSAWLISPDGWHFKLQFMFYCWLMSKNYPAFTSKPFDFQIDIMQKPGLKQTKADATWAGHIRRVVSDVKARGDFYLTRSSQQIQPENIQRFETNVLVPKLQRIALVRDNPEEALSIITNPNTNSCHAFGNRCEFYDVCEKGWDAGKFFFTNREIKHVEL